MRLQSPEYLQNPIIGVLVQLIPDAGVLLVVRPDVDKKVQKAQGKIDGILQHPAQGVPGGVDLPDRRPQIHKVVIEFRALDQEQQEQGQILLGTLVPHQRGGPAPVCDQFPVSEILDKDLHLFRPERRIPVQERPAYDPGGVVEVIALPALCVM